MSTAMFRTDIIVIGGSIDDTPIGNTSPSSGIFTTLDVDGLTNLDQVSIVTDDGPFSVSGTSGVDIDTSGPSRLVTSSGTLTLDAESDILALHGDTNVTIDSTSGGLSATTFSSMNFEATDASSVISFNTTPVRMTDTTVSTSSSTGALVVTGGLGVGGNTNIAGDLIVSSNLTVSGTTTTVESETVTISDNIMIVNSGPSITKDSGILMHRYQTENDVGSGDVVNDPQADETGTAGAIGASTIELSGSASIAIDFYKSWYVKMTSGVASGKVRQITAYSGASRIATLNSPWGVPTPVFGDTWEIYSCNYVGTIFDEDQDELSFICSADAAGDIVTITKYLNIHAFDILADGDLTVNGSTTFTGPTTFLNIESITFDTPGADVLQLGPVNAVKIEISRVGILTQVLGNFQVDGSSVFSDVVIVIDDILPFADNSSDLGSSALSFKDIYFDGTLFGGIICSDDIKPNVTSTSDIGTSSFQYQNAYIENLISDGIDTNTISTLDIGGTNASKVEIGRAGQLTEIQGDFSVLGNFLFSGPISYSTETISVAAGASSSPTVNFTTSYIDVTGIPGSPATGNMPSGTADGMIKTLIMIGDVDEYILTFGTLLVDAVGNNTPSMRMQFTTSGQSAVMTWNSALSHWYITGGSGVTILT